MSPICELQIGVPGNGVLGRYFFFKLWSSTF